MNVIQDTQRRKDFATNKPMIVKPTIIGNALMQPPSRVTKQFITPSSSRSRAKDEGQSSTSHTKSTPTVHRDAHVIVAVCEGRGKATGIVGIAAIDIHRPVLILSEISDNQTYTATLTKLNILRPVEILVPATFVEGTAVSRLVTVITNQFPNLSVTSVPRSEFNRSRGLHVIESLCASVFRSVILQINHKFYASAASSALLRYIEQVRRVLYSPKTIKVEYQEPEHTTAIDIDTAHLLELVSGKQNVSLFTVLNYCSTTPGRKLLRTNILQPPCRQNVIETRLDCVQELIENSTLLTRLQETLKPLSDIEASLTFGTVVPATASSVSERQLNYTLQLKGLLSAVQPLADELKVTKHPVFREIYNRFEGLDTRKKILELISQVVNEDAHLAKGQAGELQRCFAIKSGINGFLDLSRRLYTEGVDNMRSYVDELTANYNLPLRVQHTVKNGFHIILPLTKALRNLKKTDLPPVFIKSERFSSHFYLNTMDMINFDKRLKNNSAEIQNISNVLIYQLLVDIRPHIGDLYHLCDDVAQLDMLVSLARASSVPNWVRPRLTDTHMNLEGARHPVLEHVSDQEPVSNSIYAYLRCTFHLITGSNMSGKTILLHCICLVQVLCQVGCYVPCSRATLRVTRRMFACVAEDEAALTASSFALEITKLSYMLATLSNDSLVVLDELCRTTASDEGVALAMAVCERMRTTGAIVFVASHFIALTKLADLYPNVTNWHLETLEEYRANNTRISLKFTYKLLPGKTSTDTYGIKLSRIFNSSKSISDRAEDLHKYLLPMRKSLASESASQKPEFLKHKLQAELDLLKIRNQLTDEIQKDKITNFQHKTGLNFVPSPLTIENISVSNSVLLDRSSSNEKKTSVSAGKKISSGNNSWIPTSSNKSSMSSNHEFSVPTKSSSNQNQTKSANNHIFSFDQDINKELDENSSFSGVNSFHSFEEPQELSSIHKNVSQSQDFLPTASVPNKNLLFYNSLNTSTQSQNHNATFSGFNEFKSIGNGTKKSKSLFSQETNWSSAENTLINNNSKTMNLTVNSTPSSKNDSASNLKQNTSLPARSITFNSTTFAADNNSSIKLQNETLNFCSGKSTHRQTEPNILYPSNFESNSSTIQLQTPLSSKSVIFSSCHENLDEQQQHISNSSNFNEDNKSLISTKIKSDNPSNLSKTSFTDSILDISSPILNRNRQAIPKRLSELSSSIPFQLQMVSDSESSDNEEKQSVDSVEINEIENEGDFPEISSPDELNFAAFLNLKQGVTSTPIPKEKENYCTIPSDSEMSINKLNDSSKYFTPNTTNNTVLPPNTLIFNESNLSYESPILKRKFVPRGLEFNKMLPKKMQKAAPCESSPSLFNNSSFKSCISSADITKYSTSVITGQNTKINPFTAKDKVYEQDTDQI